MNFYLNGIKSVEFINRSLSLVTDVSRLETTGHRSRQWGLFTDESNEEVEGEHTQGVGDKEDV